MSNEKQISKEFYIESTLKTDATFETKSKAFTRPVVTKTRQNVNHRNDNFEKSFVIIKAEQKILRTDNFIM